MSKDNIKTIKNIESAFKILDMINEHGDVGTTEISKNLDLPKTTTYRILKSLESINVIKQMSNTNYTLDYHLLKYSKGVRVNEHITKASQKPMQDVVDKTGETVNLGSIVKDELVILNRMHGDFYQLQTALKPVGELYCSGMGKLFLAQWSDEKLNEYFQDKPSRTINTITTFEGFEKVKKEIIEKDIAYDKEEYEYGLSCLAVPIYNAENKIQYALSISGPTSRLEYKDVNLLIDHLKEAAKKIENNMKVNAI